MPPSPYRGRFICFVILGIAFLMFNLTSYLTYLYRAKVKSAKKRYIEGRPNFIPILSAVYSFPTMRTFFSSIGLYLKGFYLFF